MDNSAKSLGDVFSLGVEEKAQADLLSAIGLRVASRGAADQPQWPEFAPSPQSAPADLSAKEWQQLLHKAWEQFDQIWIKEERVQARFPWWAQIKQRFHQLVVYYVNKSGQKQVDFNEYLLRALQELGELNARQNQEIAALRRHLANLEAAAQSEEEA